MEPAVVRSVNERLPAHREDAASIADAPRGARLRGDALGQPAPERLADDAPPAVRAADVEDLVLRAEDRLRDVVSEVESLDGEMAVQHAADDTPRAPAGLRDRGREFERVALRAGERKQASGAG